MKAEDLLAGIAILISHGATAGSCVDAEHDQIWVGLEGDDASLQSDKPARQELLALGWQWDRDVQRWTVRL